MILTFIITSENKEIDLKVNGRQAIRDTLMIMQENGLISNTINVDELKVASARHKEAVVCGQSYEEAEIYNGDILYIK